MLVCRDDLGCCRVEGVGEWLDLICFGACAFPDSPPPQHESKAPGRRLWAVEPHDLAGPTQKLAVAAVGELLASTGLWELGGLLDSRCSDLGWVVRLWREGSWCGWLHAGTLSRRARDGSSGWRGHSDDRVAVCDGTLGMRGLAGLSLHRGRGLILDFCLDDRPLFLELDYRAHLARAILVVAVLVGA